jgi:hypothetical protein
MAANVLNSPRATQISVFVVRAFVKMRKLVAASTGILKRLAEIDKTLLIHDAALCEIFHRKGQTLDWSSASAGASWNWKSAPAKVHYP